MGENRQSFNRVSSARFLRSNLAFFSSRHTSPKTCNKCERCAQKRRTRGIHVSLEYSAIHVLSLKMLKHETFFARFHFDTAEHELSEVELVMVLAMLAIWR